MTKCKYCLQERKHEKRCPRSLPVGSKRKRAIAQWKEGFERGRRGGDILNTDSKFHRLGWCVGDKEFRDENENAKLEQFEEKGGYKG